MTKRDRFRDPDYRANYAASFLDTFIATQIRVLREQRGWKQAELAALVGMHQSRISALEDANYSRWSINTLKRLARAFDVPLQVSFGTFGSLLRDVNALGRSTLERASFDKDPAFARATEGATSVAVAETAILSEASTAARVLQFPSPAQKESFDNGGSVAAEEIPHA